MEQRYNLSHCSPAISTPYPLSSVSSLVIFQANEVTGVSECICWKFWWNLFYRVDFPTGTRDKKTRGFQMPPESYCHDFLPFLHDVLCSIFHSRRNPPLRVESCHVWQPKWQVLLWKISVSLLLVFYILSNCGEFVKTSWIFMTGKIARKSASPNVTCV